MVGKSCLGACKWDSIGEKAEENMSLGPSWEKLDKHVELGKGMSHWRKCGSLFYNEYGIGLYFIA